MTANALLDDAPETKKAPEPVKLRSAHDYSITQFALEQRKEGLVKLAKKTSEEGFSREARAIQADADAIEQAILPQFRQQRELPLVTHEQLEKEVGGALKIFITRAFSGLGDPKIVATPEGIASRRNLLLEDLTKRVTLCVKDVADEAFNQGAAARTHTSEALAMRQISTLRAQGD